MKYFRVHTPDIAWITQKPRGIFTTVGKLVEAKTMTEEEITEYWKQREYFEKVLPVPPFYEKGNPDHAVTWFKDTPQGQDIWNQLTFYREICANYGIKLYKTECTTLPGQIIYEDDYQIAVINEPKDLDVIVTEINENDKNTVHKLFGIIDEETASKMQNDIKDCRKIDNTEW